MFKLCLAPGHKGHTHTDCDQAEVGKCFQRLILLKANNQRLQSLTLHLAKIFPFTENTRPCEVLSEAKRSGFLLSPLYTRLLLGDDRLSSTAFC